MLAPNIAYLKSTKVYRDGRKNGWAWTNEICNDEKKRKKENVKTWKSVSYLEGALWSNLLFFGLSQWIEISFPSSCLYSVSKRFKNSILDILEIKDFQIHLLLDLAFLNCPKVDRNFSFFLKNLKRTDICISTFETFY